MVYTKNNYWLKKNRIANEKRFAGKRPIEKARIVQYQIKSTIYLLSIGGVLFFGLAIYFGESIFLYIGFVIIFLWISFFIFFIRRKLKLFRYHTISSLQKMNPYDF